MFLLSEDLLSRLGSEKPKKVLNTPAGVVRLFANAAGDCLNDAGFLNFIVCDGSGKAYGCPIAEFEATAISVGAQENMRKLNASHIMDIWLAENEVFAVHWEGFETRFDASTLKVIGQKYTK